MIIEAIDLSIQIGKRQLISDLSLSVDYGELVMITGKSGAGKTTLINQLSLLDRHKQGTLKYFGQIIDRRSKIRNLRRDSISYMFQNYGLLEHLTVYENLKLALKFNKTFDRKQLAAFLESFGLYEVLSKKVSLLSGGEQQRVALVRSLLKPYDIIFADEPTGNLDEENTELLMTYFTQLVQRERKAIVMVTHNKQLLAQATKVIDLDQKNNPC